MATDGPLTSVGGCWFPPSVFYGAFCHAFCSVLCYAFCYAFGCVFCYSFYCVLCYVLRFEL